MRAIKTTRGVEEATLTAANVVPLANAAVVFVLEGTSDARAGQKRRLHEVEHVP